MVGWVEARFSHVFGRICTNLERRAFGSSLASRHDFQAAFASCQSHLMGFIKTIVADYDRSW
jgi:hypothetical protein